MRADVARSNRLARYVATSRDSRRKCLRFANALFNGLESAGYRVVIAPAFEGLIRIAIGNKEHRGIRERGDRLPWSPMRPTVAYVFGVPVGIAVVELSEKVQMQYVGHGRFIPKGDFPVGRPMSVPHGSRSRICRQAASSSSPTARSSRVDGETHRLAGRAQLAGID